MAFTTWHDLYFSVNQQLDVKNFGNHKSYINTKDYDDVMKDFNFTIAVANEEYDNECSMDDVVEMKQG